MASLAERLRIAAEGFAPFVSNDLLSYSEVVNTLCRAVWTSENMSTLDDSKLYRLEAYAEACLGNAMMAPGVAAAWDIRRTMGDLMSARKPRDAVLLAAYRAANGRLSSAEIETIVRQEMTAYVQRVRGTTAR